MGNRISVNSTQQALTTGIATGNVEAVRDLLALKPELVRIHVKSREGKHTPLELAAAQGNMQILTLVFDAAERVYGSWKMGQVVNATSAQGLTLLMLACQSGCALCTRLVLSKGATARCVDAATGRTALHLAVISNSIGCIEAVLSSEGVAWNDTEMLDFWGRCKFPDMRTMHGMTALHLAACHGDEAVVSALLRGGAKLDAAIADHHASIPWCSRGSTALHLAASFGHEAVCRTLISAQAFHPDLDLLRLRNRQGLRAAQCAQLSQQPRIALMLSAQTTSNANRMQPEQFSRMVVQVDDQPDAAARGVAFRVKILLKLKEMRKKQMADDCAEKLEGGDGAAATGGNAEAASTPSFDERRSKRGTDEEEDSDGETDATAVHPLNEESTNGAAPSSYATAPSTPFWNAPFALSNTNTRVDLETICFAMATRDVGMSSILSRCLGSSLTDPSDFPEDWQLQIATMALTRASMIATSFSSLFVNYTTHYLQTSDILLAVGGKIMKASLWPEADDSRKSATGTGEAGRGKELDDSCRSVDEDDEGQCSICMCDEAMADVQLNPCRHQLCMQCMFEIAYTAITVDLTCPFCREPVEDVALSSKSSDAETALATTTKAVPAETDKAPASFPTLPELPSFPPPLELSTSLALLPSGV